MKLPRGLNGDVLVRHLVKNWAYAIDSQRGSHVLLVTSIPRHHRLPIPNHKPIGTGTLRAIIAEVCEVKQVGREEVLRGL